MLTDWTLGSERPTLWFQSLLYILNNQTRAEGEVCFLSFLRSRHPKVALPLFTWAQVLTTPLTHLASTMVQLGSRSQL